ncbi:hypothetical protein WJT74_05435 [Sphingomicrobium sp. XHP0239]|uniref:hypothetical protein n=1 Tax=Sphingomicrobium maritimum TaxID=3133972 RepID=UPI0031CC5394
MNAPKAFASLSGGLLARKGSARPAMRRQNFGQVGSEGLEDLGWNDMGTEPAVTSEEGGNVESISRNPLSGLTPSQPVVHDQQAQLAQQYAGHEDDEDYANDHADLDDSTAELWDPEADESPNVFTGNRDAKKSDALSAPAASSDDTEAEETTAQLVSRETSFDRAPVSQSTFAPYGESATDVGDLGSDDEQAEAEDFDAPQLMRTVADLKPLTDQQREEGGAWGDEEGEEAFEADPVDGSAGLTGASDDDADGDVYGEEEEATADEEADEHFDPATTNRFASFITRPARDDHFEPEPMESSFAEYRSEGPSEPADEDEDEDELLLDADMALADPPRAEAPVDLETRAVSSHAVAQAKAGAKDKAAFTLRLDKQRHLKLRLACALTGQSAQKMVTEALDRLLGEMTELDELVEQARGERAD